MILLTKGYHIINCSNCEAPLCEVFIYEEPQLDDSENQELPRIQEVQGSLVAQCIHCGDKSYRLAYEGKIAFSSTEYSRALPEPEDENKIIVYTEKIKTWQ